MTATFLASEVGIDNTIQHSAAYIKSWLKVLQNDEKMIVSAASQANKAADLILGRKWEDVAKAS